MGSTLKNILRFTHPHYLTNIFLAVAFFVLKVTSPFCHILFEDCQLEMKEWEWLTFLGCVIVLKNRKQPSYTVYVSTVCMFAKILSVLLFLRQNYLMGVIYIIVCLLHIAFIPEPAYSGPDKVTYFRGSNLEEELNRDKRVTWMVEFYAAWSPVCVNFAPIFAQLSTRYGLDNLKFGKLDITRYPEEAKKMRVDCSSWSKQLPTVILFQNGKEVNRRPLIDSKGAIVQKFIFSEDNMIRSFGLNEVLNVCKKNPLKKQKKADLDKKDNQQQNDPQPKNDTRQRNDPQRKNDTRQQNDPQRKNDTRQQSDPQHEKSE